MNKKVKYYYLLLLVIASLGLSGMIYFLANRKNVEVNKAIEQINNYCTNNVGIEEKEWNRVVSGLLDRKMEDLTAEEAFLVAYDHFQKFEDDAATTYFLYVMKQQNSKTHTYARMAPFFFLNYMSNEIAYTEEMKETMMDLTAKDINQYNGIISTILNIYMDDVEGLHAEEEIIKNILLKEDYLDKEIALDMHNNLAVVYGASGNYAKAIEQSLNVITRAEELNNNYYRAKAKIDMSAIYEILEDYSTAKGMAEEGLRIDIEDERENAFIKNYAMMNLCQIAYEQQLKDDVQQYKEVAEKYAEYLPETEIAAYKVTLALAEVSYYLNENNMQEAKNAFDRADKEFELAMQSSTLNIDLYYDITLGEYLGKTGQYEEAMTQFHKVLEDSSQEAFYKKIVYKKMIELAQQENKRDVEIEAYKELTALYQTESEKINRDYADYSIQKYNNECEIREVNRLNIQRMLWIMILIVGILVILCVFSVKMRILRRISRKDGLTGCYNRGYFQKKYEEFKEQKKESHLILFDIDKFKYINDTYGHLAGDDVLKQVVQIVRREIGNQGILYRYGGEEFIVLTKQVNFSDSISLAENIRKKIEDATWKIGEQVTISVGVSDGRSEEDPLALADRMLYEAKKSGRNQTRY